MMKLVATMLLPVNPLWRLTTPTFLLGVQRTNKISTKS